MEKIRLAVIGLNFGRNHVANILKDQMPAELAAVVDIKEDFAAMAAGWNVPFYTDYKEMLCAEKPDGAIIAVPPQFHTSIAMDCLEAGADVLIEKPITLAGEEADRIISKAKKLDRRILVGQHHRFDPTVRMAKQRLDSGALGRLIGFHVFGTLPKPEWYFAQEYKRLRSKGGGTVANNGIHDVDRIRFLCGDVVCVHAMKGNAIRGFEVEDTAAVAMLCKSGVVGTYYISDCSHPLSPYTDTYFAEKATLRFKSSSFYAQSGFYTYQEGSLGEGFDYREREKEVRTLEIPVGDNHYREVEHFCDVIMRRCTPVTTGEDGKKSMLLMNAIIESLDTNKTVHLDQSNN